MTTTMIIITKDQANHPAVRECPNRSRDYLPWFLWSSPWFLWSRRLAAEFKSDIIVTIIIISQCIIVSIIIMVMTVIVIFIDHPCCWCQLIQSLRGPSQDKSVTHRGVFHCQGHDHHHHHHHYHYHIIIIITIIIWPTMCKFSLLQSPLPPHPFTGAVKLVLSLGVRAQRWNGRFRCRLYSDQIVWVDGGSVIFRFRNLMPIVLRPNT